MTVAMEEHEKKAFDFAADLTKQLITLATSIVTIALAFGDHFPKQSRLARDAWFCYLLSVLFGLWTLMALTGSLSPKGATATDFSLGWNVRLPSALQLLVFGVATVLTMLFVGRWWH